MSPSLVGLLHLRVGFISYSLTKLLVHLERSGTYSQLCFPGAVSGAAEPHVEGTTCGCSMHVAVKGLGLKMLHILSNYISTFLK